MLRSASVTCRDASCLSSTKTSVTRSIASLPTVGSASRQQAMYDMVARSGGGREVVDGDRGDAEGAKTEDDPLRESKEMKRISQGNFTS